MNIATRRLTVVFCLALAWTFTGCQNGNENGSEKENRNQGSPSSGSKNEPQSLKVDFKDGAQTSDWKVHRNGGEIQLDQGELSIRGKTRMAGWATWNGIASPTLPEGDFIVSVKYRVRKFSGNGDKLVTLDAMETTGDETWVSLWLSQGARYGMNMGPKLNPSADNITFAKSTHPLFGDESKEFHVMKLMYSHADNTITGFVDDELVGELNVELKGGVAFSLRVATSHEGVEMDVTYDDFEFQPGGKTAR